MAPWPWGVISTLALPFGMTTVLRVRSTNPFNAGVGRRRSRCGVAWANQPIVLWKGTSCARFFDCSIHKCEKPCHHPSPQPSEWPPSPSHVTQRPCGKSIIAPSPSAEGSHIHSVQILSPLAPPLLQIPTRLVVMAKPPRAFASRRHGEAAGMGTWQMVVRLVRQKSRIFHIVTCSEQKKKYHKL